LPSREGLAPGSCGKPDCYRLKNQGPRRRGEPGAFGPSEETDALEEEETGQAALHRDLLINLACCPGPFNGLSIPNIG
jgi:hypothetical protein